MNLVIVTAAIAASLMVIAITAIRASRLILARYAILLMFLQAVFVLTIGMGGLRAHAERERARGASDAFVAGMVERDLFFFAPRVSLGVTLLGLLVVSITAVRRLK